MAVRARAKPEAGLAESFDEPAGTFLSVRLTAEQICAIWAIVQEAEEDSMGRGMNYVPKADMMAEIRGALVAALSGAAR